MIGIRLSGGKNTTVVFNNNIDVGRREECLNEDSFDGNRADGILLYARYGTHDVTISKNKVRSTVAKGHNCRAFAMRFARYRTSPYTNILVEDNEFEAEAIGTEANDLQQIVFASALETLPIDKFANNVLRSNQVFVSSPDASRLSLSGTRVELSETGELETCIPVQCSCADCDVQLIDMLVSGVYMYICHFRLFVVPKFTYSYFFPLKTKYLGADLEKRFSSLPPLTTERCSAGVKFGETLWKSSINGTVTLSNSLSLTVVESKEKADKAFEFQLVSNAGEVEKEISVRDKTTIPLEFRVLHAFDVKELTPHKLSWKDDPAVAMILDATSKLDICFDPSDDKDPLKECASPEDEETGSDSDTMAMERVNRGPTQLESSSILPVVIGAVGGCLVLLCIGGVIAWCVLRDGAESDHGIDGVPSHFEMANANSQRDFASARADSVNSFQSGGSVAAYSTGENSVYASVSTGSAPSVPSSDYTNIQSLASSSYLDRGGSGGSNPNDGYETCNIVNQASANVYGNANPRAPITSSYISVSIF